MSLRLLAVLSVAALASACASTGAAPRPFPTPGVSAPRTSAASAPAAAAGTAPFDGYALTTTALSFRGIPYRSGGSDPNGFDCSGFTQYVFSQYGVKLPRAVKDQFLQGKTVKADELAAGDLLFFSTSGPGPSHVGIAIDADEFVHAPSSSGVVRVERISQSYWLQRFVGARRVN